LGALNYVVRPGDCLASIAVAHGFHWKTLWQWPENAALKQNRQDPHVLHPGDQVFIPALRPKESRCETDRRHRFKLKGVPERIRIAVTDEEDRPMANQPYMLEIDGVRFEGSTDASGMFEHAIPPGAKDGHLSVGEGESRQDFRLALGHLDPVTEISGAQGRLLNLGYYAGLVDGQLNAATRTALLLIQDKYGLSPSAENDAETQAKLKELVGC
jgi:hypothetical protein